MSVKSPNPTVNSPVVDPSVSVKTAVKPRQTAAITSPTIIQQFLRKFLLNDNQTFISMARNGECVIIEGINDGNFSKIVQCLDEQAKTSSLYKPVKLVSPVNRFL